MTDEVKRLTIKEWAENDRPREKLIKNGVTVLSDAELLAILIGTGNKNESAVELARKMLSECHNNINELALLTVFDLCNGFKGIGEAKAITIIAALELGKRRKTNDVVGRKKISSSIDLYELFEVNMADLHHEEFWIALLDGANKVIDTKKISQGGSQNTIVDIPLILKFALEKTAVSIAVAHNHPSGQNYPSREDEKVTKHIRAGCEAVGLRFIDHIIVARGGRYYSFCDEGKM
ncbi:MAG: DNA repair protein RadC [Paludibacter sp.]|nr:DNA repair protein RadC [Paludibacter sp.]